MNVERHIRFKDLKQQAQEGVLSMLSGAVIGAGSVGLEAGLAVGSNATVGKDVAEFITLAGIPFASIGLLLGAVFFVYGLGAEVAVPFRAASIFLSTRRGQKNC